MLSTTLNAQASNYDVGDVVDNFTVVDTEGNTHELYEITASGKHVYLDFFFDTCPPCQATSPIFGDFFNKYGCNSGDVYCLVINNGSDSDAEVIAYEEAFGGSGNHAPAVSADGGGGAVTSNFGVGAFPTYILIGPDNKLIEKDIYPIADVSTYEATFYGDFNPDPMPCGFAGIEEEKNASFAVYPNPANEMVTISFNASQTDLNTINIYNMLGELVLTNQIQMTVGINRFDIDLGNYHPGNYIVEINTNAGVLTQKLQVTH